MAHGDGKLQAALGNDISLKKYLGEAGLNLAPSAGLKAPLQLLQGLRPPWLHVMGVGSSWVVGTRGGNGLLQLPIRLSRWYLKQAPCLYS